MDNILYYIDVVDQLMRQTLKVNYGLFNISDNSYRYCHANTQLRAYTLESLHIYYYY